MSFLLSICNWLWNALKKAASFIVSVPGLISSGVVSVCSTIATLFSNFSFWSDISDWITEASGYVESIIPSGTTADFLLGFFAVDRFAAITTVLFGATVGITIAVFITMFLSILVLLPTIFGIKFAIRAISIFTGGFVKP